MDFSVQLHGEHPGEQVTIALSITGPAFMCMTHDGWSATMPLTEEKIRRLLLMLDAMLDAYDYDRLTLGLDRLGDAVNTEPL